MYTLVNSNSKNIQMWCNGFYITPTCYHNDNYQAIRLTTIYVLRINKKNDTIFYSCKAYFLKKKNEFFFGLRLYVPVNKFFSRVGTFFWVEPVLSNVDEVSCSKTQHCAPGEIRNRNLAIQSPTLYLLS